MKDEFTHEVLDKNPSRVTCSDCFIRGTDLIGLISDDKLRAGNDSSFKILFGRKTWTNSN